jgi:hypothetical protein
LFCGFGIDYNLTDNFFLLQGTRKIEQNTIMDAFVTMTSQRPELEDSSFLTSLDMDPSSLPPTQNQNQNSFLSFGALDLPGTPPTSSTPRFGSLALSAGDKSKAAYNPMGSEVTAQRAFNDLRRFGSMLVGRREASDTRGR